MIDMSSVTFVVATNDHIVLEKNFLASPCLVPPHSHQVLLQERFSSASRAYNDAIDKTQNDLLVFAHQDVIFPKHWISQLLNAVKQLEEQDPNWGVLGCYGETQDWSGKGYVYSSGLGIMGKLSQKPEPVQTLDEIV